MKKMMNKSIELTIPAKAEYLHIVRLTLFGIATKAGFSFEEIEDMKVAVTEACNNVVLYAYKEGASGILDIHFELIEDGLSIHIKDEGNSFDFEKTANKLTSLHDKTLVETDVKGLGIFLMHALMDKVQVLTDKGTEVILTKQLCRKEEIA
ncbi:MAG: putative anti-sigma regulatory factor, serine/threonine protein kinase [Bacilli bacterium]|nr:putative anti-sigma regulatory factor, serine/threonine protein kinase [Bacilli bacterium]